MNTCRHFAVYLPSGNMIHACTSCLNYALLHVSCAQSPLDLPAQCTTGCWCCDSSHPPCRV